MKNLSLKLFAVLFVSLLGYSLQAQLTQNIFEGETKNYSVDTVAPDGGPNGTTGSTYTWTVFDATNTDITGTTMTITNTPPSTSGNAVTINWDTTPAGQYTLHVLETNGSCEGTEEFINVIISPIGSPVLTALDTDICSGETAEFEITGASANSIITFTVTGGTAAPVSPITVDASGNGTIIVTHDGTTAQIDVTLTSMELPNGTVVAITPPVTANTTVIIITTSTITFD
ncbi:hypothetical protein [Moheibacter sediminis]|uniref:Uncharacterized protein n=1 Tax=Moheibacter sediminis TaxID=1434700 RepID=A0A1W1ZJR4_9FLAO|nr:hypothetical protein [Moheibacter sediminis]SMC48775.1 hypothetical protein SAMN06296427_10315 [Moheibacter sediminis]